MQPLIQLENISKHYATANDTIMVLKNINLSIAHNAYVALMGPSGSGKSTLMNILGCLDQPSTGNYFLDNQNISNLSDDALAAIRNQKIGFVFQQFNLLPRLTALENVALPLVYAGVSKSERLARANDMLVKLGLANRITHKPNALSGGQCQRVAIARALINKPSLILADEPTGNLDTQTSTEIMELFAALHNQGNTIIIVTHEEDIAQHAQQIIRLKDGCIA
jgi:putative ABC transport system ATP-binding protein